ncbi:MAG: hypothetical protein CMJ18_21425 [Phycisphaeraceae bacterium]|nr:hypothetical protein [Phycisphaeraceae bacterium]
MAVGTVELAMYAIRAGVRLGQAARRAFVEQTKLRAIRLPVPRAGFELSVLQARTFFSDEGAEYIPDDDELSDLHDKAVDRALGASGDVPHDRYLDLFLYYRSIYLAEKQGADVQVTTGLQIEPDVLLAMFRFEQWDRADPNRPKPLRRVLGAVVEVGIEYFATVPGAISAGSRHQKVLKSFVEAVNDLDFEQIALDEDPLSALVGGLLIAALETIGEQPELVSSDANVQELVRVTTTALGSDIARRLAEAGTTDEVDAIESWGALVFRSVLRSAGRHVLERPSVFLGVRDDAQGALVSRVGIAALDLVASDSGLDPQALFSREGLDRLISSALEVVADHPELIVDTDHEGVEALISAIARDLSAMDRVVALGVAPEVARIVLSRSGEHLELIWPDLKPENHLLLTAARVTLEILTKKPRANAKWKPQFARGDLLTVVDAVVDELAGNPGWLLALAEDADENLRVALDATLGVLRRRADERLSLSVASDILVASIRAVSLRQKFLEKLPNGRNLISAAIDAIISELFKAPAESAASWQLLRNESIVAIVEIGLESLVESELDEQSLRTLRSSLAGTVQSVIDGEAVDMTSLEAELLAALTTPAE